MFVHEHKLNSLDDSVDTAELYERAHKHQEASKCTAKRGKGE